MGATLNIAIGKGAYTLTDRASWEMFGNKLDFEVLVEGDKALFNQYGVMAVSPEKCPNTNAAGGQAFLNWLTSDDGQGHRCFQTEGQAAVLSQRQITRRGRSNLNERPH